MESKSDIPAGRTGSSTANLVRLLAAKITSFISGTAVLKRGLALPAQGLARRTWAVSHWRSPVEFITSAARVASVEEWGSDELTGGEGCFCMAVSVRCEILKERASSDSGTAGGKPLKAAHRVHIEGEAPARPV